MSGASPVAEPGTAARTAVRSPPRRHAERVLSPVERLSEVLFGLVMALSITGSVNVAAGGQGGTRELLVAALGCNAAWGIVDAVMYLISTLVERHQGRALLAGIRAEPDPARAQGVIADSLPPIVAAAIRKPELEHLQRQLAGMEELPRAGLTGRDLLGALGVFLLVFASTLPVVVPFLLPLAPRQALRVSNGVALVLLFAVGHRLGRHLSYRPLVVGASMVALGVALVAIVMALGG